MPRNHLAFKNLKPSVIAPAVALFDAKPWRLDALSDEQEALAQAFADGITTAYGCVPVKVTLDRNAYQTGYTSQDDEYGDIAEITMDSWSIFTLMKNVRTHVLTVEGATPVGDDSHEDPTKWACSLFYAVKPVMFRARVRQGRIYGMTAADTYSTESWEKLCAVNLVDPWDNSLSGSPEQIAAALAGLPVPVSENADDSLDDSEEIDVDVAAHDIAEAIESGLPEGTVVGEDERAVIRDSLSLMTRDQIRALCVANNVPRQGRNKDQLVVALREAGVTG